MSAVEPSLQRDLGDLYRAHHGWLLGWLRRRLSGADHAADLAHDTFLSVLTGGDVAGIREPRPFLATVARRLAANHHRRRLLEEAYLEALAALPEAVAPSPEARALALEALVAIDRALDGLTAKARQAFLLAHLEGLSYAQIAARLAVSTSSVKQYLVRANQQVLFALPS